jgi:hypothetical protein
MVFRRYRELNLAPSDLLPGPIELPKFFDTLSESFRNNDTVPDPPGELRADACGRVTLVQEYQSGPITLVAYCAAYSGLGLAFLACIGTHRWTG